MVELNDTKKTSTVALPSNFDPFILQVQGPVASSPDLQKNSIFLRS